MATLGSLVVSLEANIAKFQSDLGKATYMAERAMGQIASVAHAAGVALEGVTAGLSVAAIVGFGRSMVNAADQFERLHTQTGLSVAALSAMDAEARHVGSTLDVVALAVDRMQKNAFMAAGGNQQLSFAFRSIGISARELTAGLKNPDALFLSVARHMAQFADDGNKTALMMTLFGRSGAEMTEFLNRMADTGYAAAYATEAQAKQARALNAAVADLTTDMKSAAMAAVVDHIPSILKFLNALGTVGTSLKLAFEMAWVEIRYDFVITFDWLTSRIGWWARGIGDLLSKLPASMGGDWGRAMQAWGAGTSDMLKQNVSARAKELADIEAQWQAALKAYEMHKNVAPVQGPMEVTRASIRPPPDVAAGRQLEREMNASLSMLKGVLDREGVAFKLANKQLDQEYDNGLLSLQDYLDNKVAAFDKNLAITQDIHKAEIAVAEYYAGQMAGTTQGAIALAKAQELAEAKGKDADKASIERIALIEKLTADGVKLARSIEDVQVAYYNANGETDKAAALQTEMNNATLKATLLLNGQTEALRQLEAVEKQQQLYANKDATSGVMRSMDAYKKRLEDVASATERITTNMFQGIEDVMTDWMATGKLTFKSFIDSMIKDIARFVVQQEIMRPLLDSLSKGGGGGGGGLLSGIGSFLGGLFGGGMAGGGPLQQGRWYVAGEHGPEPVWGGGAGAYATGYGGGASVVINNNIDARGATQDAIQLLPSILRSNNDQLEAKIVNGLKRGNYGVRV